MVLGVRILGALGQIGLCGHVNYTWRHECYGMYLRGIRDIPKIGSMNKANGTGIEFLRLDPRMSL